MNKSEFKRLIALTAVTWFMVGATVGASLMFTYMLATLPR